MNPPHIFYLKDVERNFIDELFALAKNIEDDPTAYADKCKGKILALLFFEPSTRTKLSFESAMLRLGGQITGFSSAKVSSASKGESISDTLRMINHYADIVVIRHFREGIGEVAKKYSNLPVISGGTGTQAHPTQALLDLYTIKKEFKEIEDLTIGVMGDLKYGRTVPSFLYGLSKFSGIDIKLISPIELQIRRNISLRLDEWQVNYTFENNLSDVLDDLDVLYVTRIQKERFPDPLDYERLKGAYKISADMLSNVKTHLAILHPLPRVNEIEYDVDVTKHAKYFEQAKNGVWIRMALILKMLGLD